MTQTTLERIDKARRLLIEGRLTIHKVEVGMDGWVHASCKGDSGAVYNLGFDPRGQGEWRCSCEARTVCSHLKALKLVVVR